MNDLLFDVHFNSLDLNTCYVYLTPIYKLQSKILITMSASLHTQTGLHNLTIQLQITE